MIAGLWRLVIRNYNLMKTVLKKKPNNKRPLSRPKEIRINKFWKEFIWNTGIPVYVGSVLWSYLIGPMDFESRRRRIHQILLNIVKCIWIKTNNRLNTYSHRIPTILRRTQKLQVCNIPNTLDAALGPDTDTTTQILKFLNTINLYNEI